MWLVVLSLVKRYPPRTAVSCPYFYLIKVLPHRSQWKVLSREALKWRARGNQHRREVRCCQVVPVWRCFYPYREACCNSKGAKNLVKQRRFNTAPWVEKFKETESTMSSCFPQHSSRVTVPVTSVIPPGSLSIGFSFTCLRNFTLLLQLLPLKNCLLDHQGLDGRSQLSHAHHLFARWPAKVTAQLLE